MLFIGLLAFAAALVWFMWPRKPRCICGEKFWLDKGGLIWECFFCGWVWDGTEAWWDDL